MKLRNFAVALGVAALTLVGITPAVADSTDNTNGTAYWEIQVSNDLGGAPVTCYKDEQGSVSSDGKHVVLDSFDANGGSATGYVALIVKGGSEGEDGAGNKVYMFPNAGTEYATPLNGGGQQAGVSHWIVCTGAMPVTYDVTCDAVTVSYPQGIDSIDVNIRWTALPGGPTTTQNYHPNTGAADGQVVKVDIAATGYYSVDWVQVNGTNYHWQTGLTCGTEPQIPEQPQPKVTYGDWIDGQWACEDETVSQTRTKTTTPYVWVDGAWVLDTANASTEQETGERALTESEYYSCPDDTPQPPQPQDKVTYGDWLDGQWFCDDTTVTQTRTVTTTPFTWNGEEWVLDVANAKTSVEALLRDLLSGEITACETDDEPEPVDPTVDANVSSPMCDADGPYLAYTIEVNDPQGTVTATSATLTFHHPYDDSQDWSIEVGLGTGTAFWPGVTHDGEGTVVTWPGWRWDVAQQTWIEDADANYGWTREPDTSVEVTVDPLVQMLTVTYSGGNPGDCLEPTIVVVDDVTAETPTTTPTTTVAPTKAAAATPVKSAASYAG